MASIFNFILFISLCVSTRAYFKLDLLFVLDCHEDVKEWEWYVQRQFIKDVIDGIGSIGECDINIGLMYYGSKTKVGWNFEDKQSTDKSAMISSIDALPLAGGVCHSMVPVLDKAKKKMFSKYNRAEAPNVAVIIKSGKSESVQGLPEAAEEFRKIANVLVVGETNKVDEDELNEITGTSEHVYSVNTYEALKEQILSYGVTSDKC